MYAKKNIGYAAAVLPFVVLALYVRTYAYIRCFVPIRIDDPYANVRATSHPGELVLLGVLTFVVLNFALIGSLLVLRRAVVKSEATSSRAENIELALDAFFWGTVAITLPLFSLGAVRCNWVQPAFFPGMLGPTLFACSHAVLRLIQRQRNAA